jgi:hypothetical protein
VSKGEHDQDDNNRYCDSDHFNTLHPTLVLGGHVSSLLAGRVTCAVKSTTPLFGFGLDEQDHQIRHVPPTIRPPAAIAGVI